MGWIQGTATALRVWLAVVAGLRLLSVYFGFFDVEKLRKFVYDKNPGEVSGLQGRTFSAWTSVSCMLAVATAYDLKNTTVYAMCFVAFVIALGHFLIEVLIFKNLSLRRAFSPLIVAGISVVWMALGWTRYT